MAKVANTGPQWEKGMVVLDLRSVEILDFDEPNRTLRLGCELAAIPDDLVMDLARECHPYGDDEKVHRLADTLFRAIRRDSEINLIAELIR